MCKANNSKFLLCFFLPDRPFVGSNGSHVRAFQGHIHSEFSGVCFFSCILQGSAFVRLNIIGPGKG